MEVLIVGKNGQLAWELQRTCPSSIDMHVCSSQDIDITSLESVDRIVSSIQPDVIINAAAYTAVDKAEVDRESAFLINETGVENISQVAKRYDVRLLHVSTDFVFDGCKNSAYETNEQANPICVYGLSKLKGEQAIKKLHKNAAIIRTSWLYSEHGQNFVNTMLHLMKDREKLDVVSDQIGCPTSAHGLAKFLWSLAEIDEISDIYHYCDLGVASWYDFAISIQSLGLKYGLLDKRIPITPISSSEYPTLAQRPTFSLLSSSVEAKGYQKHWTEALEDTLESLCKS
ncbi:dTDP-4-dehydrorhamnose reductase [Vibrio galatheae]|uniref:dTDP-4-dehydrorhamnose reductase n=1 Tax=Vibrio galatheae TaxID=579748 RepID=A0A0F4NMS6_9VIBR|nr:dTDP-4-dehydrorhamnose reductase [Vibrio galatheae]KJY84164.1 dTDP-4-dehydrorhamnose reductase [Vibrio galatheae]